MYNYLCQGGTFFKFVDEFVCLSVNKITEKIMDEGEGRSCNKDNWLDFWDELHSDSGILFLLQLFAMCKITLLHYCSLVVSPTNADDFGDQPDFNNAN